MAAVLSLLQTIGQAYRLLCLYRCQEAIAAFQKLPPAQYNTGWIYCQVGRAYFELVNYPQAKTFFEQARKLEPYRTEGQQTKIVF